VDPLQLKIEQLTEKILVMRDEAKVQLETAETRDELIIKHNIN
jgi:hypothetical protein